jgi:hypothetical protein
MRRVLRVVTIAAFGLIVGAQSAAAQWTFVGSWQVDQGPVWSTLPPQYSGLEAAALLFGGSPFHYAISTRGSDPNSIDLSAWYSTWGGACGGAFPCGTIYAEGFKNGVLYDTPGAVSTYVSDWAVGPQYTNSLLSGIALSFRLKLPLRQQLSCRSGVSRT